VKKADVEVFVIDVPSVFTAAGDKGFRVLQKYLQAEQRHDIEGDHSIRDIESNSEAIKSLVAYLHTRD
jgi:hypothetical protein